MDNLLLSDLLGLTEEAAVVKITAANLISRITNKNGKALIVTRDLSLQEGLVIKATVG